MGKFDTYTHVADLWNELGIRTRDPLTKTPSYYKIAFQPTTFNRCAAPYATGQWKTIAGEPVKEYRHKSMPDYKDYVRQAETNGLNIYGSISPIYQFIAENVGINCGLEFKNLRTVFIDIEVDSRGGFASPDDPYKPITAITVEVWGQYLVWGCGSYSSSKTNVHYTQCVDESALLTSFAKWWSSDYPDIISGWNVSMYDIPYIVNRINRLHSDGHIKFGSKVLSPWGKLATRQVTINNQTNNVIDIVVVSTLDYNELYRKFSLTQQESYKLDYIAEVELGENKISYDDYGSLQDLADKNYQLFVDYNIVDVELVRKLNDKLHHIYLCVQLAYGAKVNFTDPFKQVRMWDAIIYYDRYDKTIVVPMKKDHDKSVDFAGAYVKDPQVGKHSWLASFDVNSLYPSIMREWNISTDRHLSVEWLKNRLFQIENANPNIVGKAPELFSPIEWISTVSDAQTAIWALTELIASLNTITVDSMMAAMETETPYPWLKVLNVCVSANRQVYRADIPGFLPTILGKLYNDRKKAKSKETSIKKKIQVTTDLNEKHDLTNEAAKWGLEQNTIKVLLNSCYGGQGNNFSRWFDVRHAESITLTGQMIIRLVANRVNAFLSTEFGIKKDYVVGSDTDSVIITLSNLVGNMSADTNSIVDFVDKFCEKKLQPIINKTFQDIHDKLNTQESILAMKREAIAEHGVWTAKKRYILWIHDNEGVRYNPPKLKITGIEAVRSSTPRYARVVIKQALEHFVKSDQDAFYALLDEARSEFDKRPFDDIASPRSVNGLSEYPLLQNGEFSSRTPIHVKGALIYNKLIDDNGLENKYPTIVSGQKIKFCYLKQQNPFKVNVIATPNKLPKELNIDKFLDRSEQFQKTIAQPLEGIIKYAGWPIKPTTTLF